MSDNEDITSAINTDNNATIAENAAIPSITTLQQTDNFQQPNTSPYDDKSKSDSDEEDNPVDVAVITALKNLRNCLRRGSDHLSGQHLVGHFVNYLSLDRRYSMRYLIYWFIRCQFYRMFDSFCGAIRCSCCIK